MRMSSNRVGRTLALACIAAALAVVPALAAFAHGSHRRGSAVREVRATGSLTPGRLAQIAQSVAAGNHDSMPSGMQAVWTSRGLANAASDPQQVHMSDAARSVVLITMEGQFTWDDRGYGPPGARPFHGTVMTLVVDSRTGQVLDIGMQDSLPNMRQLGAVVNLAAQQSPVSATRCACSIAHTGGRGRPDGTIVGAIELVGGPPPGIHGPYSGKVILRGPRVHDDVVVHYSRYRFRVPAGLYRLSSQSKWCSTHRMVLVHAGHTTHANLTCDTY